MALLSAGCQTTHHHSKYILNVFFYFIELDLSSGHHILKESPVIMATNSERIKATKIIVSFHHVTVILLIVITTLIKTTFLTK